MQFGLYRRPDQPNLVTPGFDYLEEDVSSLLKPEVIDDRWHRPPPSDPPVLAAHSLIPDLMPIVGPDVDLPALRLHVQRACERAAQIGVRVITLSSPGAMRAPEEFDARHAKSQVVEFLRTAVPFFARYELMLVAGVNSPERCNMTTTLPEVLQYVWQVDHPWFQCLLDVGKVLSGEITMEQLADAMPWVRHVHVPFDPAGAEPVFAQLRRAKYQDMISVTPEAETDWRGIGQAIDSLRIMWGAAQM